MTLGTQADAPRLLSVATAVPPYRIDQDAAMALAGALFDGAFPDLGRLLGVFDNAAIATRYSCVPIDWYRSDHGLAERNRLYIENAVDLLERVARDALDRAGVAPDEIDAVVSVSSTGIATPSLDALLMERISLRADVQRLPIFGLGCAGGVLGLGRAAACARAEPGSRVLFLVVELCALTFRRADLSKSNLVAVALFGDGAAAAVIGPGDGSCNGRENSPAIVHWGEHLWPNSLDVMGWRVADDGFGVVFSRDIPALVRERMGGVAGAYLARHGLTLGDVDGFLCHPGGAKVIDALEEIYGMDPGGLTETRSVLRDYGNMSAATALFVLERAMAAGLGRRQLLSALGPGFTAAFLTLESTSTDS